MLLGLDCCQVCAAGSDGRDKVQSSVHSSPARARSRKLDSGSLSAGGSGLGAKDAAAVAASANQGSHLQRAAKGGGTSGSLSSCRSTTTSLPSAAAARAVAASCSTSASAAAPDAGAAPAASRSAKRGEDKKEERKADSESVVQTPVEGMQMSGKATIPKGAALMSPPSDRFLTGVMTFSQSASLLSRSFLTDSHGSLSPSMACCSEACSEQPK